MSERDRQTETEKGLQRHRGTDDTQKTDPKERTGGAADGGKLRESPRESSRHRGWCVTATLVRLHRVHGSCLPSICRRGARCSGAKAVLGTKQIGTLLLRFFSQSFVLVVVTPLDEGFKGALRLIVCVDMSVRPSVSVSVYLCPSIRRCV